MHHRKVSRGELRTLQQAFHYHPRLGTITWRIAGPRRGGFRLPGDEAGTLRPDGYVVVVLAGQSYRAHHLAYLLMKGDNVPDGYEIHHRDDNPRNNRWSNLKVVTRKQHLTYAKEDASTRNRRNWQSESYRAARAAAFADPEVQARRSQAVKAAMTSEVIAKSQTQAARAKRKASVRAAWSDPALRAAQSERLKAHWRQLKGNQ